MTDLDRLYRDCTTIEEIREVHKQIKSDIRRRELEMFDSERQANHAMKRKLEKAITEKLDSVTHSQVSDWQEGETIYFTEISKMDLSMGTFKGSNDFHAVDRGEVYQYQPRKKLLWLKFTKQQVTKSQWHDRDGCPLQPFRLNEVRKMNMRRTDVGV